MIGRATLNLEMARNFAIDYQFSKKNQQSDNEKSNYATLCEKA